MRRTRLVLAVVVPCVLLLLTLTAGRASAAPSASGTDLNRQLAEKYSPILVVRKHTQQCGDGEPYLPISVDAVLGRKDVVLRTPSGTKAAPTARDLAAAGRNSYLDLPGDALRPGCSYEKWYDQIKGDGQPSIYARVATDSGHVVVQYWFYYVYNDWNDLHESDWEMIQVQFDVPTVEQALAAQPALTAYAQHEGSEVARWDDTDKLLRSGGSHPVVYPGQGSHASYYTQAVWLGRGAATGFGCDDTNPVGTLVRPAVILLPQQAPKDPGDRFAWLAFPGHWGQQEPSFNNGPTGPATKTQWSTPVAWVAQQGRSGSVSLPAVPTIASKGFCDMVDHGSTVFVWVLDRPVVSVVVAVLVLVALVWLIRRTRWRGGEPSVVDRERTVGQILTSMFVIAARSTPQLLPVAVVVFAGTYVVRSLRELGVDLGPPGTLTDLHPGLDGWWTIVMAGVGWAVLALIDGICAAVVLELVQQVGDRRRPRLRAAVRSVWRHRTPVYVFLLGVAIVAATLSTFWLFPVALVMLTMWSVSMAAAGVENQPLRRAFRRSALLVRIHPVKSAVVALLLLLTAAVAGPVLGGVLLLVSGWPVWISDLAAGVVTAIVVPAAVIGLGLLFYDLRRGEQAAGAQESPQASPVRG